jgi:hypothetical protein
MRFLIGARHGAFCSIAACCFIMLMLAPVGQANILAPGGNTLTPDNFTNGFDTGAVIKADTGVQAFTGLDVGGVVKYTGNFRQIVIVDNTTGFLDFLYEFEVTGGPSVVERLTTINFQNHTTDVGYCSTCLDVLALNTAADGDVAPVAEDRSLDGSTIGWDFAKPTGVGTGKETFVLVIKTDSTTFGNGSTTLLDGGIAALRSYDPTPEPISAGLLLGGLFGAGLFFARKFQVKQG